MQLWSSIHLFTSNTEKAQNYFIQEVKDDRGERTEIECYLRRYYSCRGENLDSVPIHDNDRHFIELFEDMYPAYTPGFVIQRDFNEKGLHLNLFGDIIRSPQVVSAYSSRYFGGMNIKSAVYHNICRLSREKRCPVVSLTVTLSDSSSTCKIYAAKDKNLSIVLRSTDISQNFEQDAVLLKQIFPSINCEELFAQLDPLAFSDYLCDTLNIIGGGPKYKLQLAQSCKFISTRRLYDIYDRMPT